MKEDKIIMEMEEKLTGKVMVIVAKNSALPRTRLTAHKGYEKIEDKLTQSETKKVRPLTTNR